MPSLPTGDKCIFGFENCPEFSTDIDTNPYTFFIGYQVDSQYYKQHTMALLGSYISENLKSDLRKLNLQILHKPFGFRPGIHIFCDACKLIQKSILCIFEISDLNPNVMLEIGKSKYKNIVLLRRNSSGYPIPEIPSNIKGIFYESYDNEDELVSSKSGKISTIIYNKIIEHNNNCYYKKFYLKDEISKICINNKFNENIDWEDLLEIYDESKLKEAHDFTLIGIAKYKKLKREYIEEEVNIDYFEEVKEYFKKSKKLSNKIVENEYYLFNLNLIKEGYNFIKKADSSFNNIKESQKSLDDLIDNFTDVIELINIFYNRRLNEFLFIDSPILLDIATGYSSYNLGLFQPMKIYKILKFLDKKRIINDFNKRILSFLKNLPPGNNYNDPKYQIVGIISKELTFEDIGEEILDLMQKSKDCEYKSLDSISSDYSLILDKDLKEKLSYLLGIFGDIRAENILISLIDNNISDIIYPAIDALAKINSVKSLPIIINIYKNLSSDSIIKQRAINAITILAEKNNISDIKNMFDKNNY